MDSRQLANAETGASMAFAHDRGAVFQGNYNERREGTTNHFHAQVVYYNSPNRQIQNGGARAQRETDYANPPSHSQRIPIPFFPYGRGGESQDNSSFRELIRQKCEVCQQFIPRKATGLIEYRRHPFWSQKYCSSHEHDNTARCCSCERLVSWNAKVYSLEDGRSLCFECMESAIMDIGECQPLYRAIRDFYEGMNMKIDQQIPLLLVQREALNDAIVGKKNDFHHIPETRGLCLSEEQTIMRRMGMRTNPKRLFRKREVTAILVLYGLPRLLTGAIITHELMRAWFCLKGYRNLDPEVEEGICHVLSMMWLECEMTPSSSKKAAKPDIEKKLGEFFRHQISYDSFPGYEGGYLAAQLAVNKYGLRCTLEHIRMTGHFPL